MDKVQKIREEVVKLKSQLLRGACSSQIAMETRCKEEAYDEVLTLLDSLQEERDDVNNLIKSQNNSIKVLNETLYNIERNTMAAKEHVDYDKLDTILDESLSKETKESWNEGLDKKCMYAQPNYTNIDRLVLCARCKEECRYAQKEADWIQELHCKFDSLSKEDFEKVWTKYAQKDELVSETNKVVQVRRCLEEAATTINSFVDEVIEQFNLKDKSIVTKEIQYRGVGLKGDFGENIHRSDDEVIYILKEDKAVGLIVIRRTEFNNAEITMVKTEERFKKKSND